MTGLYLHLPFCRVHCTYCPFAISTDLGMQEKYVDALLREIAALPAQTFDTIYFGGGTPSRTSLAHLERIVSHVIPSVARDLGARAAHESPLAPHPPAQVPRDARDDIPEFSMEANPEDVTAASVAAWKDLGVNRLSIGVQSFHDDELRAIGRIHDRARALQAVETAVASGIRTNLDLILGLPHQTASSFTETLDTAVALGAGHLSLYMLDLEDRTPLAVQVDRGRVTLPDDEMVASRYLDAVDRLNAAGLQQYEISNFARAGEECLHNLRYWTRGEYHGLGLGAHSFIGNRRFANTRDMHRYIELSPDATDFSETLGEDEARRETLFLSLRQTRGMDYEGLISLCGQEGLEWTERGLREQWLRREGSRVAFTPSGFLHSNDYISQLF